MVTLTLLNSFVTDELMASTNQDPPVHSVPLGDASSSAMESDSEDDIVLAHYCTTLFSEREVDLEGTHSDIHLVPRRKIFICTL